MSQADIEILRSEYKAMSRKDWADLTYTSDLYCLKAGEPIRLEIMWRSTATRAAIANYVLGKLGNYGKAIGLISR
jgi:hypothetical protein